MPSPPLLKQALFVMGLVGLNFARIFDGRDRMILVDDVRLVLKADNCHALNSQGPPPESVEQPRTQRIGPRRPGSMGVAYRAVPAGLPLVSWLE